METSAKPKTTPKDFFLYLAVMAMLYVSVGALIALWFNYIDYLFPDRLQYYSSYDFYSGSIRWYIALLLTIFPSFVAAAWYAGRELEREPEKRDIGIRKWLMYLTLFVAAASMLVDVVVLINTFLGGELTTRFVLKVLSVLVVAGAVVAYYLLDLRGATLRNPKILRYFSIGAALVVLGSIIGGFLITGSPATQRALRFDQTRVNDLQSIQWQVVNYWQQKKELPQRIEQLADSISGYAAPNDPESGQPYGYKFSGQLSFELCASFNRQSQSVANTTPSYPKGVGFLEGDNWTHGAGEHCFTRTIDPDRYPPARY